MGADKVPRSVFNSDIEFWSSEIDDLDPYATRQRGFASYQKSFLYEARSKNISGSTCPWWQGLLLLPFDQIISSCVFEHPTIAIRLQNKSYRLWFRSEFLHHDQNRLAQICHQLRSLFVPICGCRGPLRISSVAPSRPQESPWFFEYLHPLFGSGVISLPSE